MKGKKMNPIRRQTNDNSTANQPVSLTVLMSAEFRQEVEREAKEENRTISAMLRQLAIEGLKARKRQRENVQ